MTLNSLPIAMKECFRTSLFRAALVVVAVGLLPQASFAHTLTCGNGIVLATNINDSYNWIPLLSCKMELEDGAHGCVVTASADINTPVGSGNAYDRYRFAVWYDGGPPVTNYYYERTAVFTNNAGIIDAPSTNVSTVGYFSLPAGTYTFTSYARKWSVATTNASLTDSSLGVVCSEPYNPQERAQ